MILHKNAVYKVSKLPGRAFKYTKEIFTVLPEMRICYTYDAEFQDKVSVAINNSDKQQNYHKTRLPGILVPYVYLHNWMNLLYNFFETLFFYDGVCWRVYNYFKLHYGWICHPCELILM